MQIVHKSSAKVTYTAQQIGDYLAEPDVVQWIQLGKLLDTEFDACVDGRETNPIIGNPGGDVSRLAEVVIAIAKVSNRHFKPGEILKIFDWYVSHFGRFYMHTDEHAMENLRRFLNEGYGAKRMQGRKFESSHEMYDYVLAPEANQQVFLSRYLLDPRFVGCGHMNLMMNKPKQYGMSEKVLRSLSLAFFDTLWNVPSQRDLLIYRCLRGDHTEGAVVNIVIEEQDLTDDTWVPMVMPSHGGISIFVNHPQVVTYINKKVAFLLAQNATEIIPDLQVDPPAVLQHMEQLQNDGVRQTVSSVAWGLPVYTFELSR